MMPGLLAAAAKKLVVPPSLWTILHSSPAASPGLHLQRLQDSYSFMDSCRRYFWDSSQASSSPCPVSDSR